jgi:hypothetical protein
VGPVRELARGRSVPSRAFYGAAHGQTHGCARQTDVSDLTLHVYGCRRITENDFVDVYPMLAGHIDLPLQITSNLRFRSTRTQGNDHAVRGLIQL